MITLSIHVLTFVYKDPQTVSHYLVLTLQIITIITVIKWLNYTLFHHIVHIIFFFCFFTFTNITTVNKGNCIKSLCNQNPNEIPEVKFMYNLNVYCKDIILVHLVVFLNSILLIQRYIHNVIQLYQC